MIVEDMVTVVGSNKVQDRFGGGVSTKIDFLHASDHSSQAWLRALKERQGDQSKEVGFSDKNQEYLDLPES